jgi:hypothetical protein
MPQKAIQETPSQDMLIHNIVKALRKTLPGKEERKEWEPISDKELSVQIVLFAARIICRKLVSIAMPFETMPPLHRNEEMSPKMVWIANTVRRKMLQPIVAYPASEWERYEILGSLISALAPHIQRAASRERP